jgi:hypothetical protein
MQNLTYLGSSLILGLCAAVTNCSTSGGGFIGRPVGGGSSTIGNPSGGGSTTISIGAGGQGGRIFTNAEPTCDQCEDFKDVTPIVETGAESGPASFTGAASGAGPCIIEPEPGSLFPRNWLRPRLNVQGGAKSGLFQITIHADREVEESPSMTSSPGTSRLPA